MKKIYTALVAVLLFACIPAIAQKGLYFGLSGTVQSTWITNQNNYGLPEMDYKMTFGGAGNLNIGYDFTNHLGIKMEIGYEKFGQKYTDSRDSSTFDREIRMNYLTIPIMFKYRVGGPIVKFYLAIGPQFNLLMAAKQTYNKDGLPFMEDVDDTITGSSFKVGNEEIKERFSSSDIYARMDLGLNVMIIKHLMIEAGLKLGYGLMDLNSANYRIKDSSGHYNASHGVFGGITVGINYHL
jgi:hypothetical protein